MNYEKPGGVMHEVIRRAFEELRLHNNPQGAITIVTYALATADGLPQLLGGRGFNNDAGGGTAPSYPRLSDAPPISTGGGSGDFGRLRVISGTSHNSQSTAKTMQWLTAGSVGVSMTSPSPAPHKTPVSPPAGSAEWLNRRHTFNRTQLLRLLLIRCEAYSTLKQHARALQDAEKAVEVSQGQSAEAYFNVGREQRRLFNIAESASAFDTAEALLRSMQQAIAAGNIVYDGWSPEASSDEVFWADRGFQMDEVRDMGITRREYEMQENSTYRNNLGNSFSRLTSPTSANGTAAAATATTIAAAFGGEPATPLSSAGRGKGRLGNDVNSISSFAASPYDSQVSPGNSATTRSITGNANAAGGIGGLNSANNNTDINKEFASTSYISDVVQCGMSPNELAMWRRLATESRALLAMQQSHTVPASVISSTMMMLDIRVSGTRGGLVVSIENNTHMPLRFVGALAPDGLYHEAYSFPDVINKSNCGVSMLKPRGWGGYSGTVCYELHENLCCFFYFDSPLLGSVKYGVRFADLSASDLRRAYAEVYKETGVYGIAGGTTATAITPPASSAVASLNSSINLSVSSTNISNNGSRMNEQGSTGARVGIPVRGANTPLMTTVASMNAARAAIRMPPSSTWVMTHAASASFQQPVKASSRMVGGQAIAFSLAEVLAVRLRSVELIPALEYVGAVTLKKMSSVNRRYRELINNLPPPMFYGMGRRSYPDYCVRSDRFISPWIVRDPQPVTWKLIFDGRMADQEEFFISDENDLQKHILCFSADAQTKVTGYVYLGDKRCLQYIIKESWIPFSNTLYFTTPIGRTFASCVAVNNQTQYTLSLTSSSAHNSGATNNANGSGGGAPRQGDDVLYTARKRVDQVSSAGELARGTSANATPIPTGNVRSGDGVQMVKSEIGPSLTANGGRAQLPQTNSNSPTGVVDIGNGGGSAHHSSPGQIVLATPVTSGLAVGGGGGASNATVITSASKRIASGSPSSATSSNANCSGSFLAVTGTVNSSSAGGAAATSASAAAGGAASAPRPDCFTVWRSQRVSGAAVAGGAAPPTTNGGADIIAEVKVNPILHGLTSKGYCAAEITLLPGADAMLVSLLSFLMARW